ncbi:MAG: lysoplasmalogenase [Aquirufa sp.]
MKSTNWILYFFGLDACLELLAPFLFPSIHSLRFVTKPLLMILLSFYVFNQQGLNSKKTILLALFFAWLGDVFLMIPGSNPLFFQLGLAAFLLMQITYITIFLKQIIPLDQISIQHRILSLLSIVVYVALLLNFLLPNIVEGLRIPVIIYAFALGSMLYFALQRIQISTSNNYWQIAMGAFLFVVSDSLLAFGKFYYSFPGNSFIVMSTYIISQLLLIKGLVTFVPVHKK